MRASCIALLVFLYAASSPVSSHLIAYSYSLVDPSAEDVVVLFFNHSDPLSHPAVPLLIEASEKFRDKLEFFSVDASEIDNAAAMAKDSFGYKFPRVFVSVGSQGMEEYTFPLPRIEEFLTAKLAKIRKDVVRPLDVAAPVTRVTLIKFEEKWCKRCKAMAVSFAQAAEKWSSKVQFVTVECSASEGHTLFCDNYGVAELPSIFLVTEDQKRVRFHGPFNPFGFDEFLTSHLGPAPSQEKSEL